MIPYNDNVCNQYSDNLYDIHSYPYWPEVDSVNLYSRTSPNQSGEQRLGEYQIAALEQFANGRGLKIAGRYPDVGRVGHRIGPETTPRLFAAINDARPIIAFDWQRLCREPHKLARYPVHFISLVPLSVNPAELNGIRKREANRQNPGGKGGRPKNREAWQALPFILSQLGRPWAQIARELGEGWSDNKAKRVLLDNFIYRDETR